MPPFENITEQASNAVLTQTTEVQTDTPVLCASCSGMQEENEVLRANLTRIQETVATLTRKLNAQLELEHMNDNQALFYTGISKPVFFTVLGAIAPFVRDSPKCLTQSQQLLLLLMKLRMGAPLKDLAFRFAVSEHTASSVFKSWLSSMQIFCQRLINFPAQNIAKSWLTKKELEHFPNLRAIIDCSEIPVSR